MLKLLNSTKSRINYVSRHISTSSISWQNRELAKAHERDNAIKNVTKKPNRLPLVKNFFLGKVDTELMAYPEAIYEKDHLAIANERREIYKSFLETHIFANPNDVNNINKMKEFGCFKKTSSLFTEAIYTVSEQDAKILSYGAFLNSHQQVLTVLEEFGDANQKLKFMPKLESGDFIGVPCLFEPKFPEKAGIIFDTTLVFNDSNDTWTINGEKSHVLVSPAHKDSTLFAVVGTTDTVDHLGDYRKGISVAFVDGSLPGVTLSKVEQTIGFDEKLFNQVTVKFDNVILDKLSVFEGEFPAQAFLKLSRLDTGVQALNGVMNPIISLLVEQGINTKLQGVLLKDIDLFKEQLGGLISNHYALESMVYMTTALTDIYEKQDIDIECAMVQSFAVQALTEFMVRPMHSLGQRAVVEGFKYEKFIRDATHIASSRETLDGIKNLIAAYGAQYAGPLMKDNVKKTRNPLLHPGFVFSQIFTETSIENPKKTLHLEHHLHPSLEVSATALEFSILRLKVANEILLCRHGAALFEHSVELAKLADAATLCYAMFATISRASRSYCIGLRNADQEMQLAHYFCYSGSVKVKTLTKEIDEGEEGCSEHTFKTIAERLFQTKSHSFEHPTAKNF